MYKVLLVTNQPEVREAFTDFADWAVLGFEPPQAVTTAKEGMLLIDSGVVDAVAYVLPKDEGQAFFSFLAEHREVCGMEAATDPVRLRRAINSTRRALSERSGADVMTDVLPILQTEFFHGLLEGVPLRREDVRTRVAALQIQAALDAPVCLTRLRLPQGDVYLDEVWRYGRDRLEVALRNFFERDLPQVRYVLGVLGPQEIKLLTCPKESMTAEALQAHTRQQIASARQLLQEYLELEVKVQSMDLYSDLPAFCAREQAVAVPVAE